MNNNMNPTNNIKNGLLTGILSCMLISSAVALPGTGTWNLQSTPGVTTDLQGQSLVIGAPDRAILNWNNFGSGTDSISLGETINYVLPGSSASVLNIVSGANNTTIGGTIESNGSVFILNPNGIIVGNGARIDTQSIYLSAADSPFAAQMQFLQDGTLPSQKGTRTAAGNVIISGDAAIASQKTTVVARDITVNALLAGGDLYLNADGNVTIGSAVGLTYVGGNLSATNSGAITLGASGSFTMVRGNATVESKLSNVTVPAGSSTQTGALTATAIVGDVTLNGVAAPAVNATAKNINVSFGSVGGATFSGNSTGNTTVTAPNFMTIDNFKTTGTGTTAITAGAVLTLNGVHSQTTGSTTFTGSYVRDSAPGLFVYGATNFVATVGDINISKANHSFGPVSLAAAQGTALITEAGSLNLNAVNTKELVANTGGSFFQTPGTFGLAVTKAAVTSVEGVTFLGGTVANGLTVTAGSGNVDLSKLSLSLNLGGVAPVVTTTGTYTPPAL
jgi:filamentous hemagglutinin family protein